MAIEVPNPAVEALIKMLQVIPQLPKRSEVDPRKIESTGENRAASASGACVYDPINVSHVHDEVMQVKEDFVYQSILLCFPKGRVRPLSELCLCLSFSNIYSQWYTMLLTG